MVLFNKSTPLFHICHSISTRNDPHVYGMHAHDRMEFYMLIQGNVCFGIEGSEQPLQPYDIVITREAETHKLTVDPNVPYERIWIQFKKELIEKIDPQFILLSPFYNRPLGTNNLFRTLKKSENFCYDCLKKMMVESNDLPYETQFLSCFLPILCELNLTMQDHPPINSKEPADLTTKLIAHINDHLFEPLTLEKISKEFYLSKSQLNRIFQRATGSTIAHYISIKRLLNAQAKIKDGVPIHQAAQQCGYNDYSTFFRAYKSQFGVSPNDDKCTL